MLHTSSNSSGSGSGKARRAGLAAGRGNASIKLSGGARMTSIYRPPMWSWSYFSAAYTSDSVARSTKHRPMQ